MSTMAKAKKGQAAGPRMLQLGIRASSTYAEWAERLADKERMTVATLIDRALAEYAEKTGFEAPPRRIPS